MAKVISKNKYAFYNYEIIDIFEAGIVLKGWEVKSIRSGHAELKGAFSSFKDGELYISNMRIKQYMSVPGDETAPRKVLLHKSQLKKLKEETRIKGTTIVPTTLKWSSKGYVKVDLALAKGKNKIDKRETIKKRDIDRQIKKNY